MDGGVFREKSINSVSKPRYLMFSAASNYVTQVVLILYIATCLLPQGMVRMEEERRKIIFDFDTRKEQALWSIIT